MRIPNPIDKRLDFVRKQYGQKAYEKTREIVAANLGIAESEIAPGQQVNWEKFIPWLGKQVHKLLKKQKAGLRVQGEFDRLERGFLASVEPFLVKKKGRKADIERLSPKRARQFAGRQQRALGESKGEQAKKLGYKEVARLGNGYTAVVAVIDPEAPRFMGISRASDPPGHVSPAYKEWIAEFAPFQQWLGVELGNCLQFYKVNYQPHGEGQFNIQRAGGKLYGILGPKGKPVAAILTDKDGSIRETNGPGNRPPPEKDQEYVDRFVQKHLKQDGKDTAFHPPEGFPPQISGITESTLDLWRDSDIRGRRKFLRKMQGYARQQGADFSNVWPRIAVYMLVDSPYSTLASIKASSHPKKSQVITITKRVASLYSKGGSMDELVAAATVAQKVGAEVADGAASVASGPTEMGAAHLAWGAKRALGVWAWEASRVGQVRRSPDQAALIWKDEEAREDVANKLLELMRDAARAGGGAQPRRAGNPTGARALVKECQRLWECYCERPNKTRLKAVIKHCEAMKPSKATTVKSERSRCLRSARAEDRKHGYDLS